MKLIKLLVIVGCLILVGCTKENSELNNDSSNNQENIVDDSNKVDEDNSNEISDENKESINIYLFWGDGCHICENLTDPPSQQKDHKDHQGPAQGLPPSYRWRKNLLLLIDAPGAVGTERGLLRQRSAAVGTGACQIPSIFHPYSASMTRNTFR